MSKTNEQLAEEMIKTMVDNGITDLDQQLNIIHKAREIWNEAKREREIKKGSIGNASYEFQQDGTLKLHIPEKTIYTISDDEQTRHLYKTLKSYFERQDLNMKVAYIAHPISGDVEGNLKEIRKIVKEINMNEPDVVPFVPYYADCVSMDDNVPAERMRGIKNDTAILQSGMVDELRLYGPRLSEGMKQEVLHANDRTIRIVPMDDNMKLELDAFLEEVWTP